MAVDLREIVGALRISNDLERIGDLAENIAKRVILTDELPSNAALLQLDRMVKLVLVQLRRVLHSYAHTTSPKRSTCGTGTRRSTP